MRLAVLNEKNMKNRKLKHERFWVEVVCICSKYFECCRFVETNLGSCEGG